MQKILHISKDRRFYLVLVLLFIFGDIICSNYIFRSFVNQTHTQQFFSFLSLLVLQILASPLQAALSDLYCRKKSLVVSLTFSFISLVLVYFYTQMSLFLMPFLCLIIALKGAFGNTIPLSFAAIADIRNRKVRLSFGIATSPYTLGYFVLIFTNKLFSESESIILSIGIFAVLVFLCVSFFSDARDKTEQRNHVLRLDSTAVTAVKKEIISVIKGLGSYHIQMALTAYLLWEISLYSILLLYVDFNVGNFSSIAIAMLSGALFAVFFLKIFEKTEDEKMIKWGYNFSALSLIPFFLLFPFLKDFNFYLLGACYFVHTMGNVLLSAALFALLAKKTPPHECGKIYGLLESVDTIAFLVASVFIMIYNIFDLNLIFLILFSYLTVAISWIPYARFRKTGTAG